MQPLPNWPNLFVDFEEDTLVVARRIGIELAIDEPKMETEKMKKE